MHESLVALDNALNASGNHAEEVLSAFKVCINSYIGNHFTLTDHIYLYKYTHRVVLYCAELQDVRQLYQKIINGSIKESPTHLWRFYVDAASHCREISNRHSNKDEDEQALSMLYLAMYYSNLANQMSLPSTLEEPLAENDRGGQFSDELSHQVSSLKVDLHAEILLAALVEELPSSIQPQLTGAEINELSQEQYLLKLYSRSNYYFDLLNSHATLLCSARSKTQHQVLDRLQAVLMQHIQVPLLQTLDNYLRLALFHYQNNISQYVTILTDIITHARKLCDVNQHDTTIKILNMFATIHFENDELLHAAKKTDRFIMPDLGVLKHECLNSQVNFQPSFPSISVQIKENLHSARHALQMVFLNQLPTCHDLLMDAQINYTSTIRKQVLHALMEQTTALLGPAPIPFCIIGLGSVSRNAMSLYSDFEFVILIDAKVQEDCVAVEADLISPVAQRTLIKHATTYINAWVRLLKKVMRNLDEPGKYATNSNEWISSGLRVDVNEPLIHSPQNMVAWIRAGLSSDAEPFDRLLAESLLQTVPLYHAPNGEQLYQQFQSLLNATYPDDASRKRLGEFLWKNALTEFDKQQKNIHRSRPDKIKEVYLLPLTLAIKVWDWVWRPDIPNASYHPVRVIKTLVANNILAEDWALEACNAWFSLYQLRLMRQSLDFQKEKLIQKDAHASLDIDNLQHIWDRIITPIYLVNSYQGCRKNENKYNPVFAEEKKLIDLYQIIPPQEKPENVLRRIGIDYTGLQLLLTIQTQLRWDLQEEQRILYAEALSRFNLEREELIKKVGSTSQLKLPPKQLRLVKPKSELAEKRFKTLASTCNKDELMVACNMEQSVVMNEENKYYLQKKAVTYTVPEYTRPNLSDQRHMLPVMEGDAKADIINLDIILIGNDGGGKTSLVYRYIEGIYRSDLITIGSDYYNRTLNLNCNRFGINDSFNCKLNIWDIGEVEQFMIVSSSIMEKANCIIVSGFIENEMAFKRSIDAWYQHMLSIAPNTPFIFIGNHFDPYSDETEHTHSYLAIKTLAKKMGAVAYIEASSKTGENVDEVFTLAAELAFLHKYKIKILQPSTHEVQVTAARSSPVVSTYPNTLFACAAQSTDVANKTSAKPPAIG